jgi:FkbM family methyltransferase
VGRGYLESPELTAQRFVPDGFSAVPGQRLYRTGDLVAYLPDGNLRYLRRLDQQVKLRGYRIELGEIEATLARHPGVTESAVVVRQTERGEARLVAYVVSRSAQSAATNGHRRYRLPNGTLIAHLNSNETDNLYQEIFTDRIYLKHGIHLPAGACVFDVGANIGLFSLFVTQQCPEARIYAFEPLAPVHEKLALNAALFSARTKLFAYGLSDSEKRAEFAYYPRYTAKSGAMAYADAEDEVAVVKTFLRNQQREGVGEAASLIEVEDQLLAGLFESERQECSLRRLSDVLRAEGIERVDLLKVDVQRAELDVLRGIDATDWGKIEQIVMEVHDGIGKATGGRVSEVKQLLEERGFAVIVEQDEFLVGTDRYNLYASRHPLLQETKTSGHALADEEAVAEHRASSLLPREEEVNDREFSEGELQQYLRERLPEYMVPAAWVMMDKMPLTRQGKIDRQSLPAPEEVRRQSRAEIQQPRTPTEEMVAAVWAEVLGIEEVGADANFFELGGHSLLATQVVSRLREAFGVELGLRVFFREPTVEAVAAAIEEEQQTEAGIALPPLERAERGGELPLSFAQQRLWFIDQLEPGRPFYTAPIALRLDGQLNVPVLRRTLNEVVRRHEALRTTFVNLDGSAVQRIAPGLRLTLPVVDLSALDAVARERAIHLLARQEARLPFDLSAGPLLRVTLLRLSTAAHVALFTMHHIVSDGWSLGVLVREIAALYAAFSEDRPSPLEELPIQYADYAIWQRQSLQGEVLARQLDYWRRQLAGAPAMLDLPMARPRPRVQTYRGASYEFELETELAAGLRALSRRESVTLFMTLLAGFQALLARYTGQEEVVVGAAIANRTRRETEDLIGFFINTLVLRTDVSGEPRFTELLRRVREVCLGAYAHQDVPFERLVEELRPERSLSHSPLFQVAFGLNNVPRVELQLPGLQLSEVVVEDEEVRFDLTLWVTEDANGLHGRWTYRTELFDADAIKRMTAHWETLLQSIVASPDAPLSSLEMYTEAEKARRVTEGKARTESNYKKFLSVKPEAIKLPKS